VQGLLTRNGINFSAERLISAALAITEVQEAGVVALRDQDDGDEVHLVLQVDPSRIGGLRHEMDQHLRKSIPTAEYPDRVHLWQSIPLTAAGKVDLPALTLALRKTLDDRA
jgi:acyl-coenzyme A synthetase/AMP-(fatty) acid ligase